MSGFFDPPQPRRPQSPPPQAQQQRSRALIGTAIVLIATFFVVSIFTGIYTDRLWFRSLDYSAVFTKVLGTRVLLFVVFGLLMAVIVGVNMLIAHRYRPLFRPTSPEQAGLDRYREVVDPLRRWLLVAVSVVLGLFAGASAAGQWRPFLLWRHSVPFGKTDPYFDRDIGFFVFDLPWLHYLVDFAMAAVVLSLIVAAVVHYLFGGIRLQARRDRLSGAAQVQLSVLLGLFVLFKAVDYWLDRFNLSTDSGSLFTGVGYTDQHAVLPSKNILMFIALICAVLFFANVFRRTWLLPSVGLGLLVLSAVLLGGIWPGIVQQFQVKPSEPDKEGPYITRNIEATRDAYGIADTKVTQYDARQSLSREQLAKDVESLPGIRLLDPALVSEAFEQLQQVRGYYSVAPVLDVDRYPIDGRVRDLVLAVRELDQTGLPADQHNWNNEHTVYTHGFGVVAAYGNQRDADDQPVTDNEGKPVWAEQDIPPQGDLTSMFADGYQPRIYFGEKSPSYSVVGKSDGGPNRELDTPEGQGASPEMFTYTGKGGVQIGSFFNQLMYAIKFSEPNIILSSRVNENSKILYDRTPRERVEKVAPWLTVDNDVYPAVVDGRVVWVVDGYTTTDHYPNSEKRSLQEMTSDSLNPRTSYATLPTDEINYMRNSVKAVVDAYDGTVDLYAWDADPMLQAWAEAFPNLVKSKDEIPADLQEHMRYPEDQFKVQREILASYHVLNAKTFYDGSDKWKVAEDPETKGRKQPPYRLSVRTPSGGPDPVFSLTSVFLPNNRQNLASFISVDADASRDDYGTIRILRLPSNTQIPGPSQIANNFGQDAEIQNRLLAFTRANAKAIYGNLLTLPVGDGLLYVQPLYAQRESGEGRYPALRYVLVSFGEDVGIGETLTDALDDVLGISTPTEPTEGSTEPPPASGGEVSSDVRALLQQAEQKFAQAERALRRGDLEAYAAAQNDAKELVQQAIAAAGKKPADKGTEGPSPSASPSESPSS